MLLRFATNDMLNTALVDVESGEPAYLITTVLEFGPEPRSVYASALSSSASSESSSSHTPSFPRRRLTTIKDSNEKLIATLAWNGRHPDITIGGEHVGGLTDLFGSSTVRFMPKILAIPTRFDTEYIWSATSESLALIDYDTEMTKGVFHQNAVRIPQPLKSFSKLKPRSTTCCVPASAIESPSASHISLSTNSSWSSASSVCPPSSFIHTGMPGIGSNYLEFVPHPLAHDVEIIISFILMEILRRGRFSLTPYTFERPKLWEFREARDTIFRRLRRKTY
ncbi:hypothetical protein AX17_002882 [Amanita inopinata Kibby_2008]|nr:hypothetical protein AX17_002882 [Amanita inopinata Kibby_2008]